ncbi:MAG: hypothetical protein H0W68_12380, partial [Gemmatimonadaceae bacterium]|nr:hypothetical protein [Gemmatimonadaceae bacterium]
MLVSLLVALLQAPVVVPQEPSAPKDSVAVSADSSKRAAKKKRPPRRAALTPELMATAFKDGDARAILTLARNARARQDSALQS